MQVLPYERMQLLSERLGSSRVWATLFVLPLGALAALGEDRDDSGHSNKRDKSGFNLFNPTPQECLREMSADRPDRTDSAFTVDAGHFQVEMDFANVTYDHHNPAHSGVKIYSFEAAPMNLKVGLRNNMDGQLGLSPYRWLRIDDPLAGRAERKSGFGDVIPRLKLNLVGNDGGRVAVAVMPFVKLPTNQDHIVNGWVEGGLKAPYSFEIPVWEVSAQTEIDFIHDLIGSGYHPEFVNSISVGRPVLGKLSCYAEFFSNARSAAPSDWVGTFDTWLTYQVTENLRLDAGVYIGLTRSADDWHPFAGMTMRF